MIGKKKLPYKSVFAYLFGDVFLLASATQDTQRSAADPDTRGEGSGGSSAEGRGAATARIVDGKVYHISKIQVVDVPESGTLKNCFVMMFLDGFNNPYKFKTFQVASRYEKADWLRHLQARIDLCATGVGAGAGAGADADGAVSLGMGESFDQSMADSRHGDAGASGRRTRMAPSRAPLGKTLRKTNSARDLRPASAEPAGFWGLDHLADEGDGGGGATPEAARGQRQRARQLPTPGGGIGQSSSSGRRGTPGWVSRSRSLPKTPADAFEWDDFCAPTPPTAAAAASSRKTPTSVEVSDYGSAWSVAPGVAVKVANKTLRSHSHSRNRSHSHSHSHSQNANYETYV